MHEMLATTCAGRLAAITGRREPERSCRRWQGRGQAAMSGATARYLAIGSMSACLCGPAWASDLRQPYAPPSPILASTPSFSVTSYVWATAIDGKSATLPPLPAADISLRFRDVLKELNGALMASAEMRIDRWSVLVDGQLRR